MIRAILFTLIFASAVLAQDNTVKITEFASDAKVQVTRIRHYDGHTGQLLYDSKAPVKLTAENYHKLAAQGYWSWTPKKKYHAAVCTVQNGRSQGTGALIWRNSDSTLGVVATAAHVLSRGSGTIVWQSGKRSACEVVAADDEADGSLLLVRGIPSGMPVIPVSRETPPSGAFVEHCGFGGPGDNLRHFWAKWRGPAPSGLRRQLTNCYLLNGDSGGPVIYKGKLVGMNSGGYNQRNVGIGANSGSSWPLHSPAIIAGPSSVRGMVNSLMGRTAESQTCRLFNTQWGSRIFGGRRSQPPQRSPGRSPQYFPQPQPDPQGPGDGFDPYVPTPPSQAPPPPADPVEDEECRKRVDNLESGLADAKTELSEVKQIAEGNKLLAEGNAGRLDEIGSSLASIKEQLNSMQSNMQAGLTINQELTTIVNNNQSAIDELRARLDELAQAQQPKPVEPPTTVPADPQLGASKDLLLYYTARGVSGVKPVDDKINDLRDQGYPIVVTTLSPRDTKIQGVPRIYVVSEKRSIEGVKNCLVYLSKLVR